MQLIDKTTHIYGFEEYNLLRLRDHCLYNTWGFSIPYRFMRESGTYIINKDLSAKAYNVSDSAHYWMNTVHFDPEIAVNHKELLPTAKKAFTHPTCKLSRSMMAEKYKKSLNPFLSDVVIIPKPIYNEFNLREYALFINEQAKIIVVMHVEDDDAKKKIKSAQEGNTLGELITCQPDRNYTPYEYSIDDMLAAKFFYFGEVLYIPNTHSWALDILTHTLPADKIVFEDSVQESLGNETNQLDFDSLCSIKDMLESSDEDTVSAGLKSLSMMDWMHYPQSIKFILKNIDHCKWCYNKACDSTSVKYMLKTISGDYARKRSSWPGNYDSEIYEEDFELFKQLKCRYHHVSSDQVMHSIRAMEFMVVNSEGIMAPNFKQRQ